MTEYIAHKNSAWQRFMVSNLFYSIFFYSEHIIKKLLQPVSKIHLLVTAFLIFTEGKNKLIIPNK